jgi:hypothetical protein
MRKMAPKRDAGPSKEVDEILAGYGPEVCKLLLETRATLLKMFPGLQESADVKSKVIGYGYGAKYADMICSMMPAKEWVTLGIAYAAALPDPEKIMEGAGKVHRHVKLRSESDLESPALRQILKASNEAALGRRAKSGEKARK